MLHLTLAISDFMLMLITAALWTGAGFAGWAILALLVLAAAAWAWRRFLS